MKTNKKILSTMLLVSFFSINIATMPKAEASCDFSISFVNSICRFVTGESESSESVGEVASDYEEQSSGDSSSEVSQQYEAKVQDINAYMASHNGSLPPNMKITGKKKMPDGTYTVAILDESAMKEKGLSTLVVSIANDGQSFAPLNLFHNDASKSDTEVLQEEYEKLTTPVAQGGENELSDADITFLDELQKKGKDVIENEGMLEYITKDLGVSKEAVVTAVAGGVSLAGIYLVSSANMAERNRESGRTQTLLEKATERVGRLRKKYGFASSSSSENGIDGEGNIENKANNTESSKGINSTSSGSYNSSGYSGSSNTYSGGGSRVASSVNLAQVRQSIANLPSNSANVNPAMLSVVKDYILENNSSDWNSQTASNLATCIIDNAKKYNLSALAIAAQLKAESNFSPTVTSYAGACGIAQFMPSTAEGFGINPWDVGDSIKGQCEYMSELMNSFGDYSLAWAGYNAGGGAVQKYGGIPPYSETQNYVSKISLIVGDLSQRYNKLAVA